MKDVKKIMVMIACVVLLWGQTARAVAIPMLPYVPPTDLEVFGYINNIYGVTAISEGTATEKLAAYWNLYRSVMGTAFDAFELQMQEIINGAKYTRTINIDATINSVINKALKSALQNDVGIGESIPAAVDSQEWVSRLAQHGITMTLAQANQLKTLIQQNGYYGTQGQSYTLGVAYGVFIGYDEIIFMPYSVDMNPYWVQLTGNNYSLRCVRGGMEQQVLPVYVYKVNTSDMSVGRFQRVYTDGNGISVQNNMKFTLGTIQTKTRVYAQSTEATTKIYNESQNVLTTESVLDNGTLDTTKPIVFRLPSELPKPAENDEELAEVQEMLNVLPISETEDVAESVAQLQEQANAKYGDTGDYAVDLTTLFPFCIPFDLVRIISALDAEPEAPHFTFPLPSDIENGEVVFTEYEFSLEWMSPVMVWVRRGELVLGAIGIMLMTRDIIRG